ncbi:MAG: hypothetical protein DMG72_09575 [Acidobacteria bacterium]|nr:MAG: hypothetical protein DMG72_09575 [Acidobacteriota bacterium]
MDASSGVIAFLAHISFLKSPLPDGWRSTRYYWLLLAEGHLNRRQFGAMLGRIALLPLRTG